MSVNQPPKKEENQSIAGWQPVASWFVISIAAALIILPLLPGLIANLTYSFHSFGGKAPKIYWYLSRASGFVAFTILWASMALGLGITNKMTRLWPGAPTAFAVHQYTSLLGIAFAAYHALVLIGDHFVDFSLPRLLTPFSIAFETLWVGLGQMAFYIWLAVALSFYIRQKIGQKTWRMVHYANFVVYVMAFLHGIQSGTDIVTSSVRWYYWISGCSLLVLAAYRIYDSFLKGKKFAPPKFRFTFARAEKQAMDATAKSPTRPSVATRMKNLPGALRRSQSKQPIVAQGDEQLVKPVSIQAEPETPVQTPAGETIEQEIAQPAAVDEQAASSLIPENIPAFPETVKEPEKVKQTSNGPVIKLQGTSQGKKIRVRIFGEPTTRPIPELQDSDEIKLPEELSLLVKIKNRFRGIAVEPLTPHEQPKQIIFSDD